MSFCDHPNKCRRVVLGLGNESYNVAVRRVYDVLCRRNFLPIRVPLRNFTSTSNVRDTGSDSVSVRANLFGR